MITEITEIADTIDEAQWLVIEIEFYKEGLDKSQWFVSFQDSYLTKESFNQRNISSFSKRFGMSDFCFLAIFINKKFIKNPQFCMRYVEKEMASFVDEVLKIPRSKLNNLATIAKKLTPDICAVDILFECKHREMTKYKFHSPSQEYLQIPLDK